MSTEFPRSSLILMARLTSIYITSTCCGTPWTSGTHGPTTSLPWTSTRFFIWIQGAWHIANTGFCFRVQEGCEGVWRDNRRAECQGWEQWSSYYVGEQGKAILCISTSWIPIQVASFKSKIPCIEYLRTPQLKPRFFLMIIQLIFWYSIFKTLDCNWDYCWGWYLEWSDTWVHWGPRSLWKGHGYQKGSLSPFCNYAFTLV